MNLKAWPEPPVKKKRFERLGWGAQRKSAFGVSQYLQKGGCKVSGLFDQRRTSAADAPAKASRHKVLLGQPRKVHAGCVAQIGDHRFRDRVIATSPRGRNGPRDRRAIAVDVRSDIAD